MAVIDTAPIDRRPTNHPGSDNPDYKLKSVATALNTVADLIEDSDPELCPTGESLAAIFRAFAYSVEGARLPRAGGYHATIN
jgi:hypothetical protein